MIVNVFFEIADCAVEEFGHKYLALYDADNVNRPALDRGLWKIKACSDRMWSEEDDGVKFIKNRRTEKNNTPVDMKEFFLIKLRSHAL
jgi:hypothetical protein